MNNEEDVEYIINLLEKNKPHDVFESMKKVEHGLLGALRFLYNSDSDVISKDICVALGISSARMAILLKKLIVKELVKTSVSSYDARVSVIVLTNKGRAVCSKINTSMHEKARKLMEEFGRDKLEELFVDMRKIRDIMHDDQMHIKEKFND